MKRSNAQLLYTCKLIISRKLASYFIQWTLIDRCQIYFRQYDCWCMIANTFFFILRNQVSHYLLCSLFDISTFLWFFFFFFTCVLFLVIISSLVLLFYMMLLPVVEWMSMCASRNAVAREPDHDVDFSFYFKESILWNKTNIAVS